MNRETVRNMYSSIPKNKFEKLVHLVAFTTRISRLCTWAHKETFVIQIKDMCGGGKEMCLRHTNGMMIMVAKTKYATDNTGAVTNPPRINPSFSTYFAGAIRQVQAHFAEPRENILLSLFVHFFGCNGATVRRPDLITYDIPRFFLNFRDPM